MCAYNLDLALCLEIFDCLSFFKAPALVTTAWAAPPLFFTERCIRLPVRHVRCFLDPDWQRESQRLLQLSRSVSLGPLLMPKTTDVQLLHHQ